jgi:hypothetical protein
MQSLLEQALELLTRKDSAAMKQLKAYKQQSGVKNVFRLGTNDNWMQQWREARNNALGISKNPGGAVSMSQRIPQRPREIRSHAGVSLTILGWV